MYLYRTVISEWSHDPAAYNRFTIRGLSLPTYDLPATRVCAKDLNSLHIDSTIKFDDIEGILRFVMHDERGTWIRYQETTTPRPVEHARYVDPNIKVRITPYNG